MKIQVNTDHNIQNDDRLQEYVETTVAGSLDRFRGQVTRVEVHLSDENGSERGGADDKRCLMEARVEGHAPSVVTSHASTVRAAIDGAADKLERALDHIFGKARERRRGG
ncbi:MAG: ribosome-associated translation inhibitor RaiA [Sandaracinus sp.]|nr:ribosome-associated translation inhibitor RaiA [Sandaracinus sp.]MCB9631714.1 ribosome-associated translation inhibitor RaiA [Sandaracinus sp.]